MSLDIESQKTLDEVVERFINGLNQTLSKFLADLHTELEGWTITVKLTKPEETK